MRKSSEFLIFIFALIFILTGAKESHARGLQPKVCKNADQFRNIDKLTIFIEYDSSGNVLEFSKDVFTKTLESAVEDHFFFCLNKKLPILTISEKDEAFTEAGNLVLHVKSQVETKDNTSFGGNYHNKMTIISMTFQIVRPKEFPASFNFREVDYFRLENDKSNHSIIFQAKIRNDLMLYLDDILGSQMVCHVSDCSGFNVH